MAEQKRPTKPEDAPDPSNSYERSHPGRESGMGRMDDQAKDAVPEDSPDKSDTEVPNRQDSDRQVNAQDVVNQREARRPDEP